MPLAVVTAGAMLAGWFPLSALIHQQSQLDAVRSQLGAVQQQQLALVQQAQSIDTKSAAIQLAREQYQLVAPGQSLIQVLPGLGRGQVAQSTGDPGLQPLVAPSSAPTLMTTPSTTNPGRTSSTKGFVSRLMRTLEFWR
jgi:hypothetical protein